MSELITGQASPTGSPEPLEDNQTPLEKPAAIPYFPGLEGLRAVAVLAVLLYHALPDIFQGGFLGVEVFFVISGYLITTLLLGEWSRKNTISLKGFWFRRARRLLPALFTLLIAAIVFAVLFLPREVAGLRGDVAAAFGYITNWYLVFNHKSYFESVGRPSLLQHLWSLAVEEQFYLLWPLLFLAGMRFLKRRAMLVAIIGGAVASALWMGLQYNPDVDPSRIYYGTDTRASGLLIGAALAFLWLPARDYVWQGRKTVIASLGLNLAGIASLGILIWTFFDINQFDAFLYQGGFTLVALATAVLIAVVSHPLAHLGYGVLARQPLRWVGLRSYSLYLWHWPVYMVTRPHLDVPLDGVPLLVLRFGLSALLAELSYSFVETPLRGGVLVRIWKKFRQGEYRLYPAYRPVFPVIAMIAVFLFLSLGGAVLGATTPPPPSYISMDVSQLTLATATPLPTATPKMEVIPLPVATATPTPIPSPTPTPEPPPRVLALGDSVMAGAAQQLQDAIPGLKINASRSRFFWEGTGVIQQIREAGQLSNLLIIHLGSNGGMTSKQFDEMMEQLKGVQKIVFVNLKVPRAWESGNNRVIADGVKRYPNARLLDWKAASAPHPEFFWDDGIHLKPDGAKFYARLIAGAL